MKLSVALIARSRFIRPDLLSAIGTAADATGLERVWFGDHIVYPVEYAPNYPSKDGVVPYRIDSPQLDVIVAMSWLCAATSRVGVGTSVMAPALRQPVLLAKQIASLDVLSGGRVTLGIGAGWMPEEFESLGVGWRRRGARMDEYVAAMQALWTDERPSYSGDFVSFPELYCNPKPAQAGGPPIWIGGLTSTAFRRIARYGQGWLALTDDPGLIGANVAVIREHLRAAGRDPDALGVASFVVTSERTAPAALLARRDELARAGVTELVFPVAGKSPAEIEDFIFAVSALA